LTDANLSIHCCGNECSPSSNILCKTPTSIFQEPNATATVNLLNDNDDKTPHANDQEDMTLSSTFLPEWEVFYNEFVNLTTYALAHSSAASFTPSLIVNDDNDQMMIEAGDDPTPTNSFDDSLRQLHHSVRELEKVSQQFAQFLESLNKRAPCQLTPYSDTNLQQPLLCLAPQLKRTPQNILLIVPPPAPNLRHAPSWHASSYH